jgi:hypothetical protein
LSDTSLAQHRSGSPEPRRVVETARCIEEEAAQILGIPYLEGCGHRHNKAVAYYYWRAERLQPQ